MSIIYMDMLCLWLFQRVIFIGSAKTKFMISKFWKHYPTLQLVIFLKVDLEYPQNLFSKHNDFPLAVEHLTIDYEMLSPSMKKLCDNFNLKSILPCKKLVPNFFPKKHYITHYLNLKFYVEKGLIIKKIHKILAFFQKPFLKK